MLPGAPSRDKRNLPARKPIGAAQKPHPQALESRYAPSKPPPGRLALVWSSNPRRDPRFRLR